MNRYLFTAQVKSASGYQTFFVDAETREEADALINQCGEIYAHEVDVTDLEGFEFERETTTDDFGDFPPEKATAADYEEVLTDHRRLVRELDVLLNGENAAQQASLCDIVAQVRSEKERPAPDVDEYAYDLSRQIMELVAQTHVGGVTQLQAKIQCLIAETVAPAPIPVLDISDADMAELKEAIKAEKPTHIILTAPASVPDWQKSERRDCTSCGSEGVSTLHYNGEPVCYDCWPTEPAPATTEKLVKDIAPNDVVPVGNDWFRVRYITRHGDDTTLHLQREAEKLSPYTQNDVIHLSVANAVRLMTKVKAAGGKVAE